MSEQITAFELQMLKVKTMGYDNFKEQKALKLRLAQLENDAIKIDEQIMKLIEYSVQNPHILNPPIPEQNNQPEEDTITIDEKNIDPETGEIKMPKSTKKK